MVARIILSPLILLSASCFAGPATSLAADAGQRRTQADPLFSEDGYRIDRYRSPKPALTAPGRGHDG